VGKYEPDILQAERFLLFAPMIPRDIERFGVKVQGPGVIKGFR
jgi:hypothetical protein